MLHARRTFDQFPGLPYTAPKMCMPCRARWFFALVAILAVAGAGLYAYGNRPPAPTAADYPPPPAAAPAPLATASPPSATAPASAKPAASPSSLTEEKFVEISSSVVIAAVEFGNRPDALDLLKGLTAKVVRDAGVSMEEFEAMGEAIAADPVRKQRIAEAIIKRVEARTTPEMSMKAVPRAKALQRKLQEQTLPAPSKQP